MTTSASGTACPRNLPQHFNGCTCTAAPGAVTGEATVDLSLAREMPRRLVTSAEMGLEVKDSDLEFVTDEGADVVIVPPDDGDGETYYWETQLNGHVWDGRCETRDEAADEARSASTRMAALEPLDDPEMEW
jgi:hypothetical protein